MADANGVIPVFDGHNDALLRLWQQGGDVVAAFKASEAGDIDLEKAARGGLIGGFFAMFATAGGLSIDFSAFDTPPYDLPLPPEMAQDAAAGVILGQAGVAARLEAAGCVRFIRRAEDLAPLKAGEGFFGVLHIEGAECIGLELQELDALYALGLRSVGPVWSRPTIFAEGVPFRYPSDGNTGGGLTEAGRALVARCKELGVIVDCSHMTEAGFWDVAEAGVPLVATHSNSCDVTPSARNLSEAQLRAIGETGGMVGLNFGTVFLNRDGSRQAAGVLDNAVAHLDRMIELAGEGHVGFGSDFDGAPMPDDLRSAADLPNLIRRLEAAQYGSALIERLAHGNWIGFLERHFAGPVA
ncbi:dipeptidase [Ovoidimarina sediminis]|uniref:dipeptidase n=1 Tax=Ovoidimarina sediminis TaxID=3079856 RepID=UPI002915B5BF|nr:membrane dipeptidase [Rhodophyticola sp. MJ-SS7]MDU8943430.1 membrane dipeptidase [Rhodophyticola sp. MJ-SS7]